ncbi:MAG: hypothetical protein A2W01_07860 [Candidatus Solincola sediminis]|nr:MAG: hypothetical protein A2W01_07860 [Candidatus Solincola sediminis]
MIAMDTGVLVFILTVNNYDDTKECIDSVRAIKHDHFEIVILDNGSTDNSIELLKRDFPDLKFLRIEHNAGCARGMNLGLKHALEEKVHYIWMLNNDIIVDQNALSILEGVAESTDKAGLIGPKNLYYDSPDIVNYGGGRISRLTCRTYHKGNGEIDSDRFRKTEETGYITGASLFINMDMIGEIGLFDESYFLYYEDADLFMRAKLAGWKTIYAGNSRIWHKISRTNVNSSDSYFYYMVRNHRKFSKKYLKWYYRPTGWLYYYFFWCPSHIYLAFRRGNPLGGTKGVLKGIWHSSMFYQGGSKPKN